MAVGLPGSAKLEASIWFTVFKVSSSTPPFVIEIRPLTLARYAGQSISILGSYVGNRQDSIEALDIAARGDVKCHFVLKDLADLKEYVVQSSLLRCMFDSLIWCVVSMKDWRRGLSLDALCLIWPSKFGFVIVMHIYRMSVWFICNWSSCDICLLIWANWVSAKSSTYICMRGPDLCRNTLDKPPNTFPYMPTRHALLSHLRTFPVPDVPYIHSSK